MAEPSRLIRLYGTEEPAPEVRLLRAGPITAELEAGKLRYIRHGGHEALRGLAFVARGGGWETFTPAISDLAVTEEDGRFTVSYDARIECAYGTLRYRAAITADAASGLTFTVEGEAETEFETSRTGFVVLHPVEGVAGEPCRLTHSDGSIEETVFPDHVMPLQPFFDISAMRHQVAPGLWLTCALEGPDPWETEDQRNWTDASYKTYYRPLALPFPYKLAKGEAISQAAQLTFEGAPPVRTVSGGTAGVTVTLGRPAGAAMPEVGLGFQAAHQGHRRHGIDLVRAAGIRHLVCQIDPREGHGAAELTAYRDLSEALDAAVVLEVVVPCERPVADEVGAVAEAVRAAGLSPAAVIVEQARLLLFTLETVEALGLPSFEETYGAARAAFPGVRLGGGVFTNFTELNRNHADASLFDFITHSTSAVVHEPDDRSVIETLQSLPSVVGTVKSFAGGKPYRIGPSAIGKRFNPYGPSTHDNRDNTRNSFNQQDPRHRALLGSAFALGYFARIAPHDVEAVAFGMPAGELGMVHRRMDHGQPWFDDTAGDAVFPYYHVISGMGAAAGAPVRHATSDDPTRVLALAYDNAEGALLWLANLTPDAQQVSVDGAPSEVIIGRLDENNFVQATTDPAGFAAERGESGSATDITLAPFAVCRIELPR